MNLNFLPAKARGVIYGVATVLGIIDSAALAGYAKIGRAQPIWLQFADGALAPVLAVAGVVAISHLSTKDPDPASNADVVAFQTPSGTIVAGPAAPVLTGAPVSIQAVDPSDGDKDDIQPTDAPDGEFPEWDGVGEPPVGTKND